MAPGASRLYRPLPAGEPLRYWRHSGVAEARYDVPDQPMSGEMDPFFFLTKDRNFIPHEYPCRTQFAAERRGKRPQVGAEARAEHLWLPFGLPRLDLSGFWFRPTVIGAWAETVIEADRAGEAELRLATCGGAALFVDGAEAGWMAPYVRNYETAQSFRVALARGDNLLRIWFDDLAERDARFYFQLDYVDGPPARVSLPIETEPGIAEAMEAALDAMHFERPAYDGGELALVTPPLPVEVEAEIGVAGDFIATGGPHRIRRRLAAGERRLAIAKAEALPADFRNVEVTLRHGAHAVSRLLATEICHAGRQGAAPATLAGRIDEALDEIALHGEAGVVRGLARLATARTGPETEAMLAQALPPIEDCHDCADFHLVPLLWCRARFAAGLSAVLIERIDRAVLGYRYWMDEPGDDVQWYFSENHALLFHTAAYLAGHLLPEAQFVRSGRTGREQSAVGAERLRAWLDHFERWEMAEFNSAPYFPIDLKGLCALQALAPDADIRARAGAAILRLLEIVARSCHHGVLTAAQGRSYEHSLRPARTLELSGLARMLWGRGTYGATVHCLPQLALCLRDHGLSAPDHLAGIASVEGEAAWEWCFAQGQDHFARLYHYKTRDFAMGSAAGYRWGEWGYQETVLHLRLGANPDAQVWINHPGEVLQGGFGRPSYWGGSGTLPRAHQYRGLAVLRFDAAEGQPGFTHAWFPGSAFDTVRFESARFDNDTVYASAGGAVLMLRADAPLIPVEAGPSAGCELRAEGRRRTWLIRVASADEFGGLDGFVAAMRNVTLAEAPAGSLTTDDPGYGPVRFGADAIVEAEGRRLDPRTWTIAGEARRLDLAAAGG